MFGKKWVAGQGTVIDKRLKLTGGLGSSTNGIADHEYVVDVIMPDGTLKRELVGEPTISTDWWAPKIGQVVVMEVEEKSGKIRFDRHDEGVSFKAYKAKQASSFDAALSQPPGTPAPIMQSGMAGGMPAGMPQVIGMPPGMSFTPEQLKAMVDQAMQAGRVVDLRNTEQPPPSP